MSGLSECIAAANTPDNQTLTAYDDYTKVGINPKTRVKGVPCVVVIIPVWLYWRIMFVPLKKSLPGVLLAVMQQDVRCPIKLL